MVRRWRRGPAAADRRAAGGPCGRQDGGRACGQDAGRARMPAAQRGGRRGGATGRAGRPTPNEGAAMRSQGGAMAAGGPGDPGGAAGRGAGGHDARRCICGLDAPPEQRRDKGGFGGKKTFPPKDQSRNVAYSRPPLFPVGRHDAGRNPARCHYTAGAKRPPLVFWASRPTPRKPMRYQPATSARVSVPLPTAGPPQ